MILNKQPPFWLVIHKVFPNASLKEQVFAFYPHIYSSVALSEDIIEHENTHLRQQKSFGGACWWWFRYISNPKYRVKVEVEACQNQLKKANQMCLEWVKQDKMKEWQYKQQVANLLGKMARNLSSEVYGNCISYEKANDLIRG